MPLIRKDCDWAMLWGPQMSHFHGSGVPVNRGDASKHPSRNVQTLLSLIPALHARLAAATVATRTEEATVRATDFWTGFRTLFLGPIERLNFDTALPKHIEIRVLALP